MVGRKIMSRHFKAGRLLRALQPMLPEASFRIIHERPWHSLTFAGTQICISVQFAGVPADSVEHFMQRLPDHEFDLSGQLVADIAVTEACLVTGEQSLVIHALVLDD